MRNWCIQKVWNRRASDLLWLHWWSIADLEKLIADVQKQIESKRKSGDYNLEGTRLRPI